MIKKGITERTNFRINDSKEGETIEMKIKRVVVNKEPIEDTAPIIYTPRKEGVQPQYNIRTDRFEIAIEAMDIVDKSLTAKRESYYNPEKEIEKESTEIEPIQGKE